MGMYSQPAAPNPYQTAQAQAGMNKDTAVAQTGLNAMNQYTPDGSLEYSQSGDTWADGTPRFSVKQTLSPANQQLHDTDQATQLNLATIGQQQSAKIGDLLNHPMDTSQGAINAQTAGMPGMPQYRQPNAAYGTAGDPYAAMNEAGLGNLQAQTAQIGTGTVNNRYTEAQPLVDARYDPNPTKVDPRYQQDPTKVQTRSISNDQSLSAQLFDKASARFEPHLQRQRQDMEAELANKGLAAGSAGYDNSVRDFQEGRNDLYNQTFLQGDQQQFNQSKARTENDFNQDMQSNALYWDQSLAGNNQNFQHDLAADAQNFGQWDTKNQHDFGQDLARTGQAFTQQLGANQQNFGMDLSNAQLTNDRSDQLYQRDAQTLAAGQGAQSNWFNQGMAGTQLGISQDQANYGYGMNQRLQALNEIAANRNTPLNEITALLGGSQVSAPNWTATPTSSIQPANLEGLVSSNYAQKMSSYNGLIGGLAGLGGSVAKAAASSDRRLKQDLVYFRENADGLPVYSFRYRPEAGLGDERHVGVMAQDVLALRPDAVLTMPNGFLGVDYSKIGTMH